MANDVDTPRQDFAAGEPTEREFEIGKDEAYSVNLKRVVDDYAHESLEAIRRGRLSYDQIVANAITAAKQIDAVALQHLQNAVSSAQQVNQKSIERGDVATDRIWNIDEQSGFAASILQAFAKTPVELDAIMAALAAKVAEALKD